MPWNLTGNTSTATNFLGTRNSQPLIVKANNSEALRVDPDGKVGIRTPTPQNLLHVGDGSSAILSTRVNAVIASQNPDAGIGIAQNSGVNVLLQASGAGGYIGTTSNHPVVFRTNDQDRMVLDTNGILRVGTGASSILPSRVNEFVTSQNPDAGIGIAQNSGVNVLLQASGAGGYIGTTSNHPVAFRTNDQDRMVLDANGILRVGTGASSILPSRVNEFVTSQNPDAGIGIAQNSGVNVLLQASGAGGYIGTTSNHPLVFRTNDQDRMVVETNGNVRVNGDIILANADCAEHFDVADFSRVEPGTVMVLGDEGKLLESHKAYDKRVAGVISGAGSYKPGIIMDRQPVSEGRVPVALLGKVYCKVDAQFGAIEIGDLLTTSTTPGHAMKTDDPIPSFRCGDWQGAATACRRTGSDSDTDRAAIEHSRAIRRTNMASLRDSGKLVGTSASVRQVAQQCQLPFPLSLRNFINHRGCPFSTCIRLHLKVWAIPTNPIETMLNRMREIYRTAAIGVVVASREDFTSADIVTSLRDLDVVNNCPAGQLTNEQVQLFNNRNNVGELDIAVHFVQWSTNPALNGCASHPGDLFGAVVTQVASVWTLAHEIGHVMGLQHVSGEHQGCPNSNLTCCSTPDRTRLMTGCSTSAITGTPTIDQSEIDALRSSSLAREC